MGSEMCIRDRNWATTTAGGANSSTVTSSNTIMPASGLKFTWAPPSPTIAYTALAPTCSGSARTLSAAITDPDGVPTAGAGLPVLYWNCLLYTSDAADERSSVDLGGRRIIKKKKRNKLSRIIQCVHKHRPHNRSSERACKEIQRETH